MKDIVVYDKVKAKERIWEKRRESMKNIVAIVVSCLVLLGAIYNYFSFIDSKQAVTTEQIKELKKDLKEQGDNQKQANNNILAAIKENGKDTQTALKMITDKIHKNEIDIAKIETIMNIKSAKKIYKKKRRRK